MPSRFGQFQIDPVQRRLTRQGADVHLTPLAFNLLTLLIEQAPRAVERTLLQNHPSIRPMTQYSLRELE